MKRDPDAPRRKVGRPANPNRETLQKTRRFFMLGKTALTIPLVNAAHARYVSEHGKDATDAEIMREALTHYANRG